MLLRIVSAMFRCLKTVPVADVTLLLRKAQSHPCVIIQPLITSLETDGLVVYKGRPSVSCLDGLIRALRIEGKPLSFLYVKP